MLRPSLSSHHVSRACLAGSAFPLVGDDHGVGAEPEAGVFSVAPKRPWEGIVVGVGDYLLIAVTGHVTGRARDGRRPSSARPERPARPRPWGAATAARTKTRTRCGRGGRGSGMRAKTLGHGAHKKACRRGGAGRQGSLSTEARRRQITEETPGQAPTPVKAQFSLHSPRVGVCGQPLILLVPTSSYHQTFTASRILSLGPWEALPYQLPVLLAGLVNPL